jgi:hypothetical protein
VRHLSQESQLKTEIFETLSKTGLGVIPRPAIGGILPDFLVRFPDQTYAVVEVKRWRAGHKNI